jgi:hypothetical protein
MNRLCKKLLVESLGYSSCSTHQHHDEYVRLSARGLVEREAITTLGVRGNRVTPTLSGQRQALLWLADDPTLAPGHWLPSVLNARLEACRAFREKKE